VPLLTTLPPSDWCYIRWLGYYEYDEDQNRLPAVIAVHETDFGYNVFHAAREVEHLNWCLYREDAIEWAVDAMREFAAQHEIRECESD